ncbi:hypothetical protein KIPB_011988, partial [Kipferlia bialata]|eukprot:g11988.t1
MYNVRDWKEPDVASIIQPTTVSIKARRLTDRHGSTSMFTAMHAGSDSLNSLNRGLVVPSAPSSNASTDLPPVLQHRNKLISRAASRLPSAGLSFGLLLLLVIQ